MSEANRYTNADGSLKARVGWEFDVFKEARLYRVVVQLGGGNKDFAEFPTFPEALIVALHTERSNLYAVHPSGHAFCIPPAEWETCLQIYNDATQPITGVRLKMPPKARGDI